MDEQAYNLLFSEECNERSVFSIQSLVDALSDDDDGGEDIRSAETREMETIKPECVPIFTEEYKALKVTNSKEKDVDACDQKTSTLDDEAPRTNGKVSLDISWEKFVQWNLDAEKAMKSIDDVEDGEGGQDETSSAPYESILPFTHATKLTKVSNPPHTSSQSMSSPAIDADSKNIDSESDISLSTDCAKDKTAMTDSKDISSQASDKDSYKINFESDILLSTDCPENKLHSIVLHNCRGNGV